MAERSKILIVDDEPFNVDILEQELEELGYETSSAANGEEALGKVAAEAPDLILLDVMMPIMDGFEVLKRLDTDTAYRDMPLLVVSARDLSPEEAQWVRTRSCEYLQKGLVTNEQFLQHIHQCVHHTVEQ